MIFGYARVSSKQQNLARQIKELEDYGIDKENIITEKQSGKNYIERPELMNLIQNRIRKGDQVVVTSIDRLSRNYQDTKKLTSMIKAKSAMFIIANFKGFYSDSGINSDFASMMNEFLINFMAYQAQQERVNIKERQRQGIELAKKRGVYKGKQEKYGRNNIHMVTAVNQYNNRNKNHLTAQQIARMNGISRSTLYKKIRKFRKQDQLAEEN
ncbi:resolvase [Philodulcilactobacillus myokoensis]|uniref:Resolvase n=1 Tax=Philodulcilactobacillus myokoensis TaxID=2929573 RepID=A0A9W6B1X2_9LACO|nr:recombinase family protein [Philodulcilactobacillus myokoensis]GLB47395.1 resolvase [Philodulcilactobacillus myokoensis]